MKIDDIDFRNYAGEEAIKLLSDLGRPEIKPLILWIARGVAFEQANYGSRLAIADAERVVEKVMQEAREKHAV
jgi:hypothetical protein